MDDKLPEEELDKISEEEVKKPPEEDNDGILLTILVLLLLIVGFVTAGLIAYIIMFGGFVRPAAGPSSSTSQAQSSQLQATAYSGQAVTSSALRSTLLSQSSSQNQDKTSGAESETGDEPQEKEGKTYRVAGEITRAAYWTTGGDRYHFSEKCPSLSEADGIKTGTLKDALSAGKLEPCGDCVRGS